MLWIIAIVFIVLWVLGLVISYPLKGFIRILFVVGAVMLVVRIIQGHRIL